MKIHNKKSALIDIVNGYADKLIESIHKMDEPKFTVPMQSWMFESDIKILPC